jgi:hypothetical protein
MQYQFRSRAAYFEKPVPLGGIERRSGSRRTVAWHPVAPIDVILVEKILRQLIRNYMYGLTVNGINGQDALAANSHVIDG